MTWGENNRADSITDKFLNQIRDPYRNYDGRQHRFESS